MILKTNLDQDNYPTSQRYSSGQLVIIIIQLITLGILSFCALITGTVGLCGTLSVIENLSSTNSMIMISCGFGGGFLLLVIASVIRYQKENNDNKAATTITSPKPKIKQKNDNELCANLIAEWIDPLPTEERPLAIILNGGSGTGKSSLRDRITQLSARKFAVLDSDIVKERMPDYLNLLQVKDRRAGANVHARSAYIRYQLMEDAFKQKKCVIIDSTGADKEFWLKMMSKLQKNNYEIGLIRVETEKNKAWQRCQQRGKEIGRYVPESEFHRCYEASAVVFPKLKEEANWWMVYDNNTSFTLKSHSSHMPDILTLL